MSCSPVLFFDAAYTLIKPRAKLGVIYAEVANQFGFFPNPEALTAQFSAVFHELRTRRPLVLGRPETEAETRAFWSEVINTIFSRAGEPFPPAPYGQVLFDEFSTTRCWELYPDALEVLGELRSQGVKLGVLSNFDFRLGPLLQNLGLSAYVDCVVASHQTGYEKPNPEMFRAAELALPGSSYTLVGDHWEDDVMGALAAGWNAVWVDRAGAMSSEPSPLATHSVPRCTSLAEVLAHR